MSSTSDITDRLDNVLSNEAGDADEAPLGLCEEAADEICRLREAVEAAIGLREAQKAYISSGPPGDRDDELGQEVGRRAVAFDSAIAKAKGEEVAR